MKKYNLIISGRGFWRICLIASFCLGLQTLEAQSGKKAAADVKFADRLWYGGSLGAGFSSSSLGGGLQGNIFFIGISPMVGYKITPWLSVGPRLELQYYTGRYKEYGAGPVYKYNVLNLGAGLFTRARVYRQFFVHAEYGGIQYSYPVSVDYQDNKIETEKDLVDQMLIGGGLSFGDVFASEISLLYDLLSPDDSVELPIVFRYGFTYRF